MQLFQFQKLGKVPFGNPNVIKADYDILYKNALRRCDNQPAMDLYVFMEAIEMLVGKLFPASKTDKGSAYEALRATLDMAKAYFQSSASPSKK